MYYCNDCHNSFAEKVKRSDYDEPGTTYLQQSYGEEYVCPLCGGQIMNGRTTSAPNAEITSPMTNSTKLMIQSLCSVMGV